MNNHRTCPPKDAVNQWECEGRLGNSVRTMTTSKPLRWVWAGPLHHHQRPSDPAAAGSGVRSRLDSLPAVGPAWPPHTEAGCCSVGGGGCTACFTSGGVCCGTHLMTAGYITGDEPKEEPLTNALLLELLSQERGEFSQTPEIACRSGGDLGEEGGGGGRRM